MKNNYNITMEFQWDRKKNEINKQKHGISFEEACSVFNDENGILIFDPDNSDFEDRFLLLGRSSVLRVLVVCHCVREQQDEELIRIISARKANSEERKQYEIRKIK